MLAALAVPVAGCAAAALAPGTPKEVLGLPLPPYQMHEECFALARGASVTWRFRAQAPLAFDVRYRDGAALVLPIVRERVQADEGRFEALEAHRYCLAWEAGARGTPLDYTITLEAARR